MLLYSYYIGDAQREARKNKWLEMNTYNNATLEAIIEMAEGRPEYNNGVLACLGKTALWIEWNFANSQTADAVNAINRLLDDKYGDDEASKMLDNSCDTSALDKARARRWAAWAAIQSIIDEAKNDLDSAF